MNLNGLNKFKYKSLNSDIYIWFYSYDSSDKLLNKKEIKIAKSLSERSIKQFTFSRSCARLALSGFFSIDPLNVPLNANPGEPPTLDNDLGHISFSHCSDAFVIAWSSDCIGIDIENSKRKLINLDALYKMFYKLEINYLNSFTINDLNSFFLSTWVLKESSIKWSKGNLLRDIKNWKINKNFSLATNENLNLKTSTRLLKYRNYFIGISSNKIKSSQNTIICA